MSTAHWRKPLLAIRSHGRHWTSDAAWISGRVAPLSSHQSRNITLPAHYMLAVPAGDYVVRSAVLDGMSSNSAISGALLLRRVR